MFRWPGAPWRSHDQATMGAPAGAAPARPVQPQPDPILRALNAAALAMGAADHATALAIGRRITAAFPRAPDGPRIVLAALFALGRKAEAATLLARLEPPPEDQDWYLVARIWVTDGAAHPDQVVSDAARLRAIAPANPMAYAPAMTVLRAQRRLEAAEALAVQALQACPAAHEIWRQAALIAETAGQDDLAYQRWHALTARFPHSPAGHVGGVRLSLALQQPAVTARLLGPALAAFPKNRDLLGFAARDAARARRWDEAARYWQQLIDQAPDDPALQLAAANGLLGTAPGRLKRVPEVLRRIEAVIERFPDHTPAYTAQLNALREAGRAEDADRLGAAAASRFPSDPQLAMARARIAQDLGRPEDALACLRPAREAAAPAAPLEAAFIRALCLAGRPDEAELACQAAIARFPNHVAILSEYVDLATRRGDWPDALQRAELAIRRRPNEDAIRGLLRRARQQITDGSVTDAGPSPDVADPLETAAFFKRFESLGATSAGCEFGLVQRRFGAEPLGLMRWARIEVNGLIAALLTQFEGMGREENTQLIEQRVSADHCEYVLQDSRYGYSTHTFVKVEDLAFDRMHKQSMRRLHFLRAKLLEDLQAGEKIYVFKWTRDLDRPLLGRLFAALKTYRPDCTLLCVTLANARRPKGRLDMPEPGLFVAATNSFMDAGLRGERGIDTDQWRHYCEQVAAWHDANRPAAAAS